MKKLRTIAFVIILIGLVLVVNPQFFGGLMISSIAILIGITALPFLYYAFVQKRIWLFLVALISVFLSISIIKEPYLALRYIGIAILMHGISHSILNPNPRGLISSAGLVFIGVFAILNSSVAANTMAMVIGSLTIMVGCILLIASLGLIEYESRSGFFTSTKSTKVHIVEDDDAEEVEYKEL